jgi:hypothetical protein
MLTALAALSLNPTHPHHLEQSHWVHPPLHRAVETTKISKKPLLHPEPKFALKTSLKHSAPERSTRAERTAHVERTKLVERTAHRERAAHVERIVHIERVERVLPTHHEPIPKLAPVEAEVISPLLPDLYNRDGRLNMPIALRGSHEILVHQNQVADQEGLSRIQDDEDLTAMRRAGTLVPIPASETLQIDERLPENRRFCRPWVAKFLVQMSRDYYHQFHEPLQVNSAVRTVAFQLQLLRTNGNAAPAAGETASPHLTGQAIDIAKREMTQAQIAWMRLYLLPLEDAGHLDVEEEFQQACFHVSIYKTYGQTHNAPPTSIATKAPVTVPGTTAIGRPISSSAEDSVEVED